MATINEAYYDTDNVTLGYLKKLLGITDTSSSTGVNPINITKNYGTTPDPPYYINDTYMSDNKIYICIKTRLIGIFNQSDWTLQGDNSTVLGYAIKASLANNGYTSIHGGNIITGTISADKITANSITSSQVSADIITTSNFSAQNINADRITSGTITGRTINGSTINGSNITADSTINITRGSYFFNMGVSTSHPNVSGINIGWGGASFGNKSISLQSGYYWNFNSGMIINCDGIRKDTAGNLDLRNNYTGSNILIGNQIDMTSVGSDGAGRNNLIWLNNMKVYNDNSSRQCLQASGSSGAIIRLGDALRLEGGGSSGVFAQGNGVSASLITTSSGSASSRNVKKNIKKIENQSYDEMLNILNQMNMYTYEYKYNLYKKRKQYGFIIDEIETLENYEKYFDFTTNKAQYTGDKLDFATPIEQPDLTEKIIEVKQYDPDVLDKYLLGVCKGLLNKVNDLEERIKKLEERVGTING